MKPSPPPVAIGLAVLNGLLSLLDGAAEKRHREMMVELQKLREKAMTDLQVAFLAFALKYGLFYSLDAAPSWTGATAGEEMRRQFDAFTRGWKKGAKP